MPRREATLASPSPTRATLRPPLRSSTLSEMEPWLTPLYDAEGIRAIDRWAIDGQGIPEAELMEAAGTALAEAVAELAPDGPVRIVCGKGNNGGDGLVAARQLSGMGFE